MSTKQLIVRLLNHSDRNDRRIDRSALIGGVVLAALFANELLLFADYKLHGMLGYLLVLVVSTLGLRSFEEAVPTLRGTALVAVFRLVVLGMPRFFESQFLGVAVLYGAVLPGAYLLSRIQPSIAPPTDRKRRLVLQYSVPGLLASLLLAEFAFRLLGPNGLVLSPTAADLVVTGAVLVVVAVTEELLFRGVLQRGLESHYGPRTGLVLASAAYGAVYAAHGGLAAVAVGVVTGLAFGLLYDWTDSLALVSTLHGVSNVFLFVVLPLRGSFLPL